MLAPQVADLIAADRIADRQRLACSARLAALARCCRPGALRRAARQASTALARLRTAVRHGRPTAACCSA
jgi:hypothetical protein